MAPLIALLMLTAGMSVFVFFRFSPENAKKEQVSVFNWMIIGVALMLCVVFILYVRTQLLGTVDDRWVKPVSGAGSLTIITLFFGIGFILRNFWIFKPPKDPWKTGFFD